MIVSFLNKMQRGQLMFQYSISKKVYDSQLHMFRKHIAQYVLAMQMEMTFHNLPRWSDVEADEAWVQS